MLDEIQFLKLAKKIDPVAAKDYAKAKGWVAMETRRPMYLLKHPKYHLRQIQIPLESESSDFGEAMLDFALRLQSIEERSVDQILQDLIEPNSDVLRERVVSSATETGAIPLDASIAMLEGSRKALLSAACSVLEPRLHHPRLSRQAAQQFVKSCLIGQTEYGSFVLKVICPLSQLDMQTSLQWAGEEPFARKVTRSIMTSAQKIVSAIDQDHIESFLASNEQEKSVSSNFCQALLLMQSDSTDSKLEISAKWAPSRPESDTAATVTIRPHHFKQIENIYASLRNSKEAETRSLLIGTVEELKGDLDRDGHRSGAVTLRVVADEEFVNAQVILSVPDYEQAIHAHAHGSQVALKGLLHRSARMARISDFESFRIVD